MDKTEQESYPELKLDCLQNLVVNFLTDHQLEIKYLGAVWPWQFKITSLENKNNITELRLMNIDYAEPERLKELYGVDFSWHKKQSVEDAWLDIKSILDKGMSVIAGIDGYYVHYHYPHVYKKQHGYHAVTLTGYDSSENKVFCIDTMPKFKGSMPVQELLEGMGSYFKEPWYITLKTGECTANPDKDAVWERFIREAAKIKSAYDGCQCGELYNGQVICTPEIISMLEKWACLDDVQLLETVSKFCTGTWGWEIDRRAYWLIEYLQSPYAKLEYRNLEPCIEMVRENIQEWILAYRFLFKGTQAHIRKMFERSKERLHAIKQREREILELLTRNN